MSSTPAADPPTVSEPSPRLEPSVLEFTAKDSAVLRAACHGRAEDPLAILLHGGGQTRHAWSSAAEALADAGYRAVALDQRGHGASDWAPRRDYVIDDFVDDLRRLLVALGDPADRPPPGRRPVLIGASLGGMVGLISAGEAEAPLFSGLVLVDIALRPHPQGVRRVLEFMGAHPEGFASLDEAAAAVAAYQPHRAPPRDPSGLAKNLRRGADGRWRWHYDPAFVTGSFVRHSQASRERFRAAAGRLRCPVLLVHGALSDVVTDDEIEHFLEHVPGARVTTVGDAAHMVAGDRNDAFNEAVLAFLRELSGTP